MDKCKTCGRELTRDEIGLYKKLFNRAAVEYSCIDCTAEYLGVTTELLRKKIEDFKKWGCTLFSVDGGKTE